jgi:tripartite-type tricarboxylate transporter receptor subunit TctC
VDQLIPAIKKAVESEDFKKKAESVGLRPIYTSPEDCAQEVRELMDFFATVKIRLGL